MVNSEDEYRSIRSFNLINMRLFQTFVTPVCILSLIFHHASRTTGEDHGDEDILPLFSYKPRNFGHLFGLEHDYFRVIVV